MGRVYPESIKTDLFKIKALDRFILGELMGPFFFGIMSFTIILIAGSLLFRIADLVIQRGVSIGIVIRLFLYYLPRLVAFTIPMSCLLSALLGFSKLSSNSELVALKSAGLSFQRIVRPVVIAAFFLSIGAFFMNETLVPISERAAANVMLYEVLREKPPVFKDKIFIREGKGEHLRRVLYINKMNIKSGVMQEIVVQEFEEGALRRIVSAKNGRWEKGSWILEDGRVFEIKENGDVEPLFKFTNQAISLNLNPSEIARNVDKPDQMTIPELISAVKLYEQKGMDTAGLWMALNLRIAVPWSCIILALTGAALGSRPQRSGSGVGLGLSVIIVFVYYVIMSFSKAVGEAGYIPTFLAAWIANVVFLIVGFKLCSRANHLG